MSKTVVFANGVSKAPIENRHFIEPNDRIICANGGTLHALSMDLIPDVIVGDLDSLPDEIQKELISKGVHIQRHPENKDQTDLELALQVAIKQGATEILLLTALGGRLDQHLANILLLARSEWASARLWLADGNQRAWLIRGPDSLQLRGNAGDTLSVLPLTPVIHSLTLMGVRWPLNGVTISFGSTLTVSNRFTQPEVIVELKSGIGLVTHLANK